MVEITDADLVSCDVLQVGNLRNGAPDTLVHTVRESSIPSEYHWAIPTWDPAWEGDAAAFEPKLKPAVLVNAAVRTSFAKLVEADVETQRSANAAAALAGAVFDEGPARTAARGKAEIRRNAIVHGSAVAAIVIGYRITANDLNAAETGEPIYKVDAPAAARDAAEYAQVMATSRAGWNVTLASGHDEPGYTELERSAQEMAAMTATEREVSSIMFILATAAPARAGAILMKHMHHYLSKAEDRRRHLACENQVRATESAEAKAWLNENPAMWRDNLWHKPVHPIKPELLEDISASPDTADRLLASGYGSFAVGIPAQEDMIARAGSYVAVHNATYINIKAAGSTVTMRKLLSMLPVFLTMPRRIAGHDVPEWIGKPAGPAPAGIDTRAKAVAHWLKPELEACAPRAAWMFGWYRETCSRMGIRTNSQEGSLLRSYSLRKAMETHMPMASEGSNAYSAYQRYLRSLADDGRVTAYVYED